MMKPITMNFEELKRFTYFCCNKINGKMFFKLMSDEFNGNKGYIMGKFDIFLRDPITFIVSRDTSKLFQNIKKEIEIQKYEIKGGEKDKYVIDDGSDKKRFGTSPLYKIGSFLLYKGYKVVLTKVFYDSTLFELKVLKIAKLEIKSKKYGLIEIDPIEVK